MQAQTVKPVPSKNDEQILVIPRECIIPSPGWHGIKNVDEEALIKTISSNQKYISRSLAEHDPSYKQIIPYLVFAHNDNYFLMQRRSTASEIRLRNKFSLGIGGHIRQEDLSAGATIFDWARREFAEEIDYQGSLNIKLLGLLNDDTNEVGQVHIGLVMLIQGNSNAISIKSELKSGILASKEVCLEHYENLEQWSQIVLNALMKS